MKKLSYFTALFLALVAMMPVSVCAYAGIDETVESVVEDALGLYDSEYYDYDYSVDNGYTIDAYDINIIVNENNSLDITEKITADFKTPKHGIYRYIPVRATLSRSDGSEYRYNTKVTGVSSNMPIYDKYKDGNNYVIQLGEDDVELTGKNEYEINYTYSIGKDTIEGVDELYYNIIGTGWDTTLNNISFTIKMPKDFDSSKIGFSTGEYGAEGTNIVDFSVNKNIISGTLTEELPPYQGLTARIELEDGYFSFNPLSFYARYIAQIGIALIALIAVIVLWIKYGRDKKIVEVVEFYPPENMNCAEISYWNNGIVTANDTVPMLIELANEGYLNIEDCSTGSGILKKESFKLIKRRNYTGNDKHKEQFFKGLFKTGNEVTEKDLKEKFYVVIEDIVKSIYSENRTNVFNKKSLSMRFAGWIISVAAIAANIIIFNLTNYGAMHDLYVLVSGIGIAVIAFLFSFFIRQRTDKGHEIKQQIDGFRMFLENAEKERLEMLVTENPSYFYDILPYAYVLGVSDKWTKKFESIAMQPPKWYYSPHNTMWNYIMFNHFMHHTIDNATKAMISTPQNNNGGSGIGGGSFGGGGGFSGGGFGGGGGGSW